MMGSDHIQVEVQEVDSGVILRPIGDVDLARAPSLRTQIRQVQDSRPSRLVVDLTQVSYMDSSGVATLVEAMQVARRTDSDLVLCGLQDRVRSIFEIARLDMVFNIVATETDALAI